jgi:hypothetical protein
MEALGRLFNVMPVGDGMKDCEAVTFLGYLASTGDTFTIQEAKDAAGTGAQNLVKITQFYLSKGDGSAAWTKSTQAAAATIVTTSAAAQSAVVFSIAGASLSDGYKYLKCTSTGAATVTAIVHDLDVQRTPANLPALGV